MTAYELKNDYDVDLTNYCECPICNKLLNFDIDYGSEDYVLYNGKHFDFVYHTGCIENIKAKYGAQYINDTCMQDYAEWYLNCKFNDFRYEMWLCDAILADTDNVLIYIEDNEEDFLRWVEENNEI